MGGDGELKGRVTAGILLGSLTVVARNGTRLVARNEKTWYVAVAQADPTAVETELEPLYSSHSGRQTIRKGEETCMYTDISKHIITSSSLTWSSN